MGIDVDKLRSPFSTIHLVLPPKVLLDYFDIYPSNPIPSIPTYSCEDDFAIEDLI